MTNYINANRIKQLLCLPRDCRVVVPTAHGWSRRLYQTMKPCGGGDDGSGFKGEKDNIWWRRLRTAEGRIWRFRTRLLGTTTANHRHHAENPQPSPRPPIRHRFSFLLVLLFFIHSTSTSRENPVAFACFSPSYFSPTSRPLNDS